MTSSASPSRLLLANLTVALLYAAAGCLAVGLAIPQATATPIWPSAGIALAGLIVIGYRALPGVFLGCFAFNVWNALSNLGNEEIARTALTGAFLATGATIQAAVGLALIRWGGIGQRRLDEGPDVVRFLLLAGPVSCATSATIGSLGFLLTGNLAPSAFIGNWLRL